MTPYLSVDHTGFQVYMLKRYYPYNAHVIQWAYIVLDYDLSIKQITVAILDNQTGKIVSKSIDLATWKVESNMRCRYANFLLL